MALAQSGALNTVRFFEEAGSPPLVLQETARSERTSVYKTSKPIKTDATSLFLLCSFTEHAEARGFTHMTVMLPKEGDDTYVVGFVGSADDDPAKVFGDQFDAQRLIGEKPGAIQRLLPKCPKKPSANPKGQ